MDEPPDYDALEQAAWRETFHASVDRLNDKDTNVVKKSRTPSLDIRPIIRRRQRPYQTTSNVCLRLAKKPRITKLHERTVAECLREFDLLSSYQQMAKTRGISCLPANSSERINPEAYNLWTLAGQQGITPLTLYTISRKRVESINTAIFFKSKCSWGHFQQRLNAPYTTVLAIVEGSYYTPHKMKQLCKFERMCPPHNKALRILEVPAFLHTFPENTYETGDHVWHRTSHISTNYNMVQARSKLIEDIEQGRIDIARNDIRVPLHFVSMDDIVLRHIGSIERNLQYFLRSVANDPTLELKRVGKFTVRVCWGELEYLKFKYRLGAKNPNRHNVHIYDSLGLTFALFDDDDRIARFETERFFSEMGRLIIEKRFLISNEEDAKYLDIRQPTDGYTADDGTHIYPVRYTGDGPSVEFVYPCAYCRGHHLHGAGRPPNDMKPGVAEHRVAHCHMNRPGRGYYIVLVA